MRHSIARIPWCPPLAERVLCVGRGENGYFKIAKGVNNLGIESECSWGVPTIAGTTMEDVMGTRDSLVTNEDLGASIDGQESLVQEKTVHSVKQSGEPPKTVQPEKTVTSQDDHTDSFYSAQVPVDKEESPKKQPMNADADVEFQRQRRKEGVQALA